MKKPIVKVIDTSVFCDPKQFNEAYALVGEERKKKIDSLLFDEDKRLSLGAGVLFEECLKSFGIGDGSLVYGKHKKPYLASHNNLFFSLSHSGVYSACAFYDKEIGIDIQKVKDVTDAVIKKVATNKEYALLSNLDEKVIAEEFTRLWTVKESYLKFLGTGLSVSPQKIEVTFSDGITLFCDGTLADVVFEEHSKDGYKITVCYAK